MEATADSLVNQIANLFLSKIEKQNIDPNFLQKFMDGILNKINFNTNNKTYTQTQSTKIPNESSLVKDIKKAYKDLLKDESYKTEYKKFLAKVLPLELTKKLKDTSIAKPEQKTSEGRAKLIEDKPKTQEVILAGFTDRASRNLKDQFANIFKGFFDKLKGIFDKLQGPKGGFGLLGGALALLLGGLAALVTGLMTDGPFKGLLKILSKVGIQGALKTLEIAAKFFMSGLKSAIMSPISLLKGAAKAIGQVFGKSAFKAILKPIRGFSGIFTKMLGGFAKFLKPLLKRIPLIGTVISWGFAYTRFKSGDVIGGIIDVLSGIANIFAIIPGFGLIGSAISIGLDVLNAFLDYKAGGSDKKSASKKGGILTGWLKGLGSLLYKGLRGLPVIGPFIKSIEEFSAGNYLKALKQLVYIAPPLEFIGALLGDEEVTGLTKTTAGVFKGIGSILTSLGKWMAKTLWKVLTNVPIVGPAIRGIQELFAGNFGKALKQFVYIFPPFEMIGALLGDDEVGAVAQTTGSIVKSITGVLKDLGTWVAKTMWKILSNTPIIGPALKGVKELFAGNFGKALKQFVYIFPPFEMLGALLGDEEVGAVTGTIVSTTKSIGSTLLSLGKWIVKTLPKVLKNTFIIGPLIKAIESFTNGEYLKGLKQLAYIFPPFEIIGSLLGDTDTTDMAGFSGSVLKSASQVITDLWAWMKDTLWEKISGFVNNLIGGVKDWWNNLSWDPRSWFGETPISDNQNKKIKQQTKEQNNDYTVPLAKGGIVTEPTKAIVGEAGPEAVVPLEKYFDPQQLTLNNSTLKEIASNTSNTNSSLKILSDALFKLVTVLDKKTGQGNNTTIINSAGQMTQKTTPASVIANTNIDPIRRVRMQFA